MQNTTARLAHLSDRPTTATTIGVFTAARLAGNTFLRFPYVFVTAIAAGLGTDVRVVTAILGLRELGGLATPALSRAIDRGHLPRTLAIAGAVTGMASVGAVVGGLWGFTIALAVSGVGKMGIDLAQNAWIGHHVPFARRARATATVELSWALAFLAGVPMLALAVGRWGWRAPFLIVAPFLVGLTAWGARVARPPSDAAPVDHQRADAPAADDHAPRRPLPRWSIWIYCFLQPFAVMIVFAVNGDWLATSLHLSESALGVAAIAMGIAEVAGTTLTMVAADRTGPARMSTWAMAACVPPLAILVSGPTNAVVAVGLFVILDLAIECSFVAVLPLVSELDPDNRARAISHAFVIITGSRAIGSVAAGWIYGAGGFAAISVVAAVVAAAATAALIAGRASRRPQDRRRTTPA